MFSPSFTVNFLLFVAQNMDLEETELSPGVGCAFTLTLDVKHSFHADLRHAFFAEFGSDAKHLICVGGHHADAALIQLAPRYRPLPPHLLHSLDDLKHLHAQIRLLKIPASVRLCFLHTSDLTAVQEVVHGIKHPYYMSVTRRSLTDEQVWCVVSIHWCATSALL